jgi:hypothetical protein
VLVAAFCGDELFILFSRHWAHVTRHFFIAFSQRSSSRGASIRSAHAANPGVAPRQRSVSTFLKSGASVRSVASFLNSSASLRCSPRMFDGKFSI